jgi:hypothetical protein
VTAERVNELLEHIDRLPPAVGDWLARGFERWQQGGDLADALALNQPALNDDERDDVLRAVMSLLPVDTEDAPAFLAGLLADARPHPDRTAQAMLNTLAASRCRIPTSAKQLRRIQRGVRSDGWRTSGTSVAIVSRVHASADGGQPAEGERYVRRRRF